MFVCRFISLNCSVMLVNLFVCASFGLFVRFVSSPVCSFASLFIFCRIYPVKLFLCWSYLACLLMKSWKAALLQGLLLVVCYKIFAIKLYQRVDILLLKLFRRDETMTSIVVVVSIYHSAILFLSHSWSWWVGETSIGVVRVFWSRI